MRLELAAFALAACSTTTIQETPSPGSPADGGDELAEGREVGAEIPGVGIRPIDGGDELAEGASYAKHDSAIADSASSVHDDGAELSNNPGPDGAQIDSIASSDGGSDSSPAIYTGDAAPPGCSYAGAFYSCHAAKGRSYTCDTDAAALPGCAKLTAKAWCCP